MLKGRTLAALGVFLFGLSFFAYASDASSLAYLSSSAHCNQRSTVSRRRNGPIRRHILSPIAKKENLSESLRGDKSAGFSVSNHINRPTFRRIVIADRQNNGDHKSLESQINPQSSDLREKSDLSASNEKPKTEENPFPNTMRSSAQDVFPITWSLQGERLKQDFMFCINACNDLFATVEYVKRMSRKEEYHPIVEAKVLRVSWYIRVIASQIIEDDGRVLQTLIGTAEYNIFKIFLEKELLPALLAFRNMGLNKTYDDLEYIFDMFGFHNLVVRFKRVLSVSHPKKPKKSNKIPLYRAK